MTLIKINIRELENKFNNFKFIPTLTSPTENWKGENGRVQQILEKINLKNTNFYICGLKDMSFSVREFLESRKVLINHIHIEKYN